MADPKNQRVSDEDSAQVAQEQQKAADWPVPGDEGYVHPDGTPQSQQQIEDNKRAAADRAAAGSTVHGAPAATPGPQLGEEAAAAVERAQAHSGPTIDEAQRGVTEHVAQAVEVTADEQPVEPRSPEKATQRTATTDKGKTTR